MASLIPASVEKAQQYVMGSNSKITDLKQNMVEPSAKCPMTSDFGVKQSNTDHWLSVTNEDKTGPALLEDHFGREKVS